MRGFEKAKGYTHVYLPRRSTRMSAGYDFAVCKDHTIAPKAIVLAETGIKARMGEDEVLKIYPRSSLPRKFGLTIPNNVGIIDPDYYGNEENDGAIFIQLYNFRDETVTIKKGTRIAQGIFEKTLRADEEDEESEEERRGGFGSTGMKAYE